MAPDSNHIAIAAATELQQCRAAELADRLHLPLSELKNNAYGYLLVITAERLELRQLATANTEHEIPGPVYAEFTRGPLAYRQRQGDRRQPLARAIGLKTNPKPIIIDTTAGLGRDGFILACLGCQVHLIERSPVIGALLADGMQRAAINPPTRKIIQQHMTLTVADSTDVLRNLQTDLNRTVIYLDPMYPHRTKSSLVKKEMRQLRAIVGDDLDAPCLLQLALACNARRVVVKRPKTAPPIAGPPPGMSINSLKNRFDIYLAPK